MNHKRVIITAICIFLTVTMLVLSCGNSEDEDILEGDFELTMLQIYRAIAERTKVLDLPPSIYASSYFARGLEYEDIDEYDKAIACYTKAIELDPEDALYYRFRGHAYEDRGEYDEAIADYTRAIELDPESWSAYQARGNTYDSKGEYDKAIADYTKLIELEPDFARAYYYRGLAYKSKGEYEKAASDFETVIQTSISAGLVLDAREALKSIGK
ncbi:tetratricopeptide repeat protein [Chloroflexota bacterium]